MKRSSLLVCCIFLLLFVAGIPSVYAVETVVVSGISPGTSPRGMTINVVVTGSGFTNTGTIYLYKCGAVSPGGSQRKFAGSVTHWSPTSISATFTLDSTIKVGEYGVIVKTTDPVFGENDGYKENIFQVYDKSGTSVTETTATGTVTTATTTSSGDGENSVFFDTSPSGADVYLDGENVGTSAFIYRTDKTGTHDVLVKKTGYEDYAAKVTIIRGQRVYFYAPLELGTSSDTTGSPTPKVSGTGGSKTQPSANATTTRKSSLKIPTPLGTDPAPTTEESPANPALVLLATAIGAGAVVLRRR